ncbi:hypothetical protein [Rhizobium johnstonii]|uniref:hypothetical protein n=1 Tax=Rhizobium johnstonii TaxID=3019933 RepID=UPI003F9B9A3C
MPVPTVSLRSALAVFLIVGLPAKATASDELILNHDPLSCALLGTNERLCSGPGGAWQIGRLSLAVESLAQALILSGLQSDSASVQRSILRDGLAYGFDAALVTPSMALLDLSQLPEGSLGPQQERVGEFAAFALEALYPGSQDKKFFPDYSFVNTDGFSSFPDYATALSSNEISTAIRFATFMPIRHRALESSSPVLKLFDGLSVGGPNPASGNTISVHDFLMTSGPTLQAIPHNSAFAGLPNSLAFAESKTIELSPDRREMLKSAPFGGRACLTCNGELADQQMVSAKQESASLSAAGGNVNLPSTGGNFLDSISAKSSSSESQGVGASATCYETCTNEVKGKAKSDAGIGWGMMSAGAAAAARGLARRDPVTLAGGAVTAAAGGFKLRDNHQEAAKGMQKCKDLCANLKEEKKEEKKDEKSTETKEKKKDEKSTEKKEEKKVDKKKEEKALPDSTPENQDTNHQQTATTTPRKDREFMPPGCVDAGPRYMNCEKPPISPQPVNSKSLQPENGLPLGCQAPSPAPPGRMICLKPGYPEDAATCVANQLGSVSCINQQIPVQFLFSSQPLFLAAGENGGKLVKMNGTYADLRFGDLAQAAQLAVLDGSRFSIDAFEPDLDGSSVPSVSEILKVQRPEFFSGGFGDDLGIHYDGGLTLPTIPEMESVNDVTSTMIAPDGWSDLRE